jgi:hypothetical protein
MEDACKFLQYDALTEERIDCANPGAYVNRIPKCTVECTEVMIAAAKILYKICKKRG